MTIEFVGRHVALDDRIRAHAEEKIGRLAKLLGEPVEVHITLEVEKHRQIAEVRARLRRGELLAREEAPDILDAMSLAIEKIDGQARRVRERRANLRRRPTRVVTAEPAESAAAGGGKS